MITTNIEMIFTPDPRLRNISDRVNKSDFGPELEEHMNNMLNNIKAFSRSKNLSFYLMLIQLEREG